jgi:Ca2+-binding RTX toxin-like protein
MMSYLHFVFWDIKSGVFLEKDGVRLMTIKTSNLYNIYVPVTKNTGKLSLLSSMLTTNPPRQDQDNELLGRFGNDTLDGSSGDDQLNGGGGDDYLDGSVGSGTIYSPVSVSIDAITINSDNEDDYLYGHSGSYTIPIIDGGGDDYLLERWGDNTLVGDNGDGDNDTINIPLSNGLFDWYWFWQWGQFFDHDWYLTDRLFGGEGNDAILGGFGNDILDGSSDDDQLNGGGGDDSLYGDEGNDTIWTYIMMNDIDALYGIQDDNDDLYEIYWLSLYVPLNKVEVEYEPKVAPWGQKDGTKIISISTVNTKNQNKNSYRHTKTGLISRFRKQRSHCRDSPVLELPKNIPKYYFVNIKVY